jgi:hypothetical protein
MSQQPMSSLQEYEGAPRLDGGHPQQPLAQERYVPLMLLCASCNLTLLCAYTGWRSIERVQNCAAKRGAVPAFQKFHMIAPTKSCYL